MSLCLGLTNKVQLMYAKLVLCIIYGWKRETTTTSTTTTMITKKPATTTRKIVSFASMHTVNFVWTSYVVFMTPSHPITSTLKQSFQRNIVSFQPRKRKYWWISSVDLFFIFVCLFFCYRCGDVTTFSFTFRAVRFFNSAVQFRKTYFIFARWEIKTLLIIILYSLNRWHAFCQAKRFA